MANTDHEADLIKRLTEDDISAFDQLFFMYQKAVFLNVLRITKDSVIAEDIVQEVFSTLWLKRHSIEQDRSVGGWLFISSYNRSINTLKKRSREAVALHAIANTQNGSELNTDVDTELVDIQLGILERAIKLLSPQRRKVFELCKLKGYTYEQAAKEMGISKHTVKEYLSAAVAQIKAYAQQDNDTLAAITLIILLNQA